ncbi:MAG TPA: AAA family ATPase, partial [Pseudonocardiaceae bacterium]|nr:AAA family ATPase [Pseudonocardiaceae bacterium]
MHHQAPRDASWTAGRSAELDLLDRHARAAAAGEPWIVLVEGDAGIGRTTLLRRFVSYEPDATVWWACCDPHEVDLAYGLVSQFYRHVNRSVHQQHPWSERVPGAVAPADVGLHLLRVVEAAQQARPLIIVVDDAQWMDQPSLAAIGYVLRRIEAARVLVVFAMRSARPGGGQPVREVCDSLRRLVTDRERSAVIQLCGLAAEHIHELAEHLGVPVSMPLAIRLRDYVAGNPAHALDILRHMRSDEPTAALGMFPVPDALAGGTRRFLNGLAAPAGRLLAALAVLDGYHPLAEVAEVAGVSQAAVHLAPLLAGGYVRWWPQVPGTPIGIDGQLRRDAVYLSLDPELRRQLHATVAPRVDRLAALEHRIAASTGQDDELADELEAADADRAVAADVDRLTTFLLCAADLTIDRQARERRLLRAAGVLVCAWRWERLAELAPRITDCAPAPLRALALAALAHLAGRTAAAAELLTSLDDAAPDDPDRRLLIRGWLRLAASCASRDIGRLEGAIARRVLAESDVDQPTEQRAACLAADADGRLGDGPMAALRTLDEMLAVPAQAGDPLEAVPLAARGRWQVRAGRLTDAVRTLVALHERAADDAVGETTPLVHADLAFAQHRLGDWASAGRWADLAVAAASRRGTPAMRSYVYATAACVAAPAG